MRATTFLIFIAFFLSSCCRTSSKDALTEENIKKATVQNCLNEWFTGVWFETVIYIEPSPYIPSELKRVGNFDVDVVSEAELIERFKGKDCGPLLTRVSVYHTESDAPDMFDVEVSRSAVRIPGATARPLGGGKYWKFRIEGNAAVLVKEIQFFE